MGSILVVNAGSTSLKLSLVREDESAEAVPSLDAVHASEVEAVGHRVVHGGPHLVEPTLIDGSVRQAIAELESIAPLHNAPALQGIDAAITAFPDREQVAVFDTAFHRTMPAEAATYAVPLLWRDEWGVRRYGFHGLSVQWSSERAAELLGGEVDHPRIVVCHLGGGCSVTAVRGGRSVDTTMGFSPLDGIPMATRSGAVDPGALLYVQRVHGLSVDDVDRTLNVESGVKALSGGMDVRASEEAAPAEPRAELALAVFTYRVAGAVAAMAAALGGLDAIVFTAGVGEHSAVVRSAVCARLGFLGVELDPESNEDREGDCDIATPSARVRVLVVGAREDIIAARAVRALLTG